MNFSMKSNLYFHICTGSKFYNFELLILKFEEINANFLYFNRS